MRAKIIYTSFIFLSSLLCTAQTELPTGQIEVIKDFEVRLLEAAKIRIIPAPVGIDSTVRTYQYKLLAPSPAIEYVVPEIKPLAIAPEQKPAYYPFFAKAGYGSPNSLLGLLSYDHVQSDVMDWGVDFRHLQANSKKIPLQKFSDSQGRVNGSYLITPDVQFEGYVDGKFEKHYFYAADEIPSNPDALKRNYNRFDVNLSIANGANQQTPFRYMGLLQYLFDKDDLGSKERSMRLGGEVSALLGADELPVGLKLIADLTKFQHTEERTLNNLLVEPFFHYHTGKFKIKLGGIALLKTSENELLPAIEASYHLLDNMLTLRAGWEGAVVKNNFSALSAYNPYIHTRLDSINNMVSRRIFAGIKGTYGSLLFEVTGGYTKFERKAFFLQDEDHHDQFNPVYDDGSYFGIEGSLRFIVLKNVSLRSTAFTRFYSLEHEEKPWHRPSLGFDAQATYTGGGDEYHVSLFVHGENGLPYRTVGGTETRLDPLIDLNLHGDYFFTPALGGFLEVNNILGNNRERWAGYPSYGFNIKAGAMLRL